MKPSLLLLLLTILLIAAFYLFLPALKDCALPAPRGGARSRRLDLLERAAVALVTLLYALAAFSHLGETSAPRTGHVFSEGESMTLELAESHELSRAMIRSVIGTGGFSLSLSEDGQNWVEAADFDQNYVALLKWHEIELGGRARWLRLTARGVPELSSLTLYDESGAALDWKTVNELTDEQDLTPEKPHFLNSSYFDEIYHARTALEHLRGMWPYEISHPPLGKLIIGLGISLFGMTPFGWRFSGTLFGVLMLPLVYAFARRLFGRGSVPVCCTLLLAADFLHFVQTRIATIDTYGVFFTLAMYYFMYRWLFPESRDGLSPAPAEGGRRDLALSGLCFGLGAACKWTCLYAGAGLGVIWALHWVFRFTHEGRGAWRSFRRNVFFCLAFFVLVPALIYYLSYFPYGAGKGLGGGLGMYFTRDYAKLVLDNQAYMFRYHSGVNATHPYSSRWYQWMLDLRPILYYLDYSGSARSSFGAFVNPVLCWAGLIGLFVTAWCAATRRDRRALFLTLGYLAQLVPWMFISRVTFEYHYFPCSVFLVLILGYVFSLMRGSGKLWRLPVWGLTAFAVLLFLFFYPALWGAELDSAAASRIYRWLGSWPF
ncbi:MAG: phospholipid carrier-dependent glycosyltransferase [Oscillospiraceae bacterium]|nr:phospholipid carrier-dependent glycosyltransferase [Oscillospiraceae bacterium]